MPGVGCRRHITPRYRAAKAHFSFHPRTRRRPFPENGHSRSPGAMRRILLTRSEAGGWVTLAVTRHEPSRASTFVASILVLEWKLQQANRKSGMGTLSLKSACGVFCRPSCADTARKYLAKNCGLRTCPRNASRPAGDCRRRSSANWPISTGRSPRLAQTLIPLSNLGRQESNWRRSFCSG